MGARDSGLIGEHPNGIPDNLMPFVSQTAIGKPTCSEVNGHREISVFKDGVTL